MEEVEIKYRQTPIENKKYLQRLTEYIEFLIFKEKIIEAKYYFKILNELSSKHIRTIKIGYSLSIATFDNTGVKKFDQLLYELKDSNIEISLIRLKYYISVNNLSEAENCCDYLLANTINNDCLDIIIEACLTFESFNINQRLNVYLNKKRIILDKKSQARMKKISLLRLVDVLSSKKYD